MLPNSKTWSTNLRGDIITVQLTPLFTRAQYEDWVKVLNIHGIEEKSNIEVNLRAS